jgi:acetylornithine deacetylase/succinyl-diaminopimelate desuccinylase-like protein
MMRIGLRLGVAGLLLATTSTAVSVQSFAATLDEHAQNAVSRLSQYLQIDTINPPGNESRGVAYLGQLLDEAGVGYTTEESAPGRGNLWAKLEGGKQPGLVLLHHIDVVPANEKYWSFEPLSGEVKDGYVYGRGAIDTKGLGIVQLQAFLALKDGGQKLNRDVWLIATADEEAGGFFGAGWLAKEHPEIFADVGYLLNEGGSARVFDDDIAVMVEVTQKVPLWLRLTSHGRPGHGSAPQVETSVTRLVRGLKRVSETEFPVHVIEPVKEMFEGIAPFQSPEDRARFADITDVVSDRGYLLQLKLRNPGAHALLRNTCSITRLEGSSKINVVPAEAHAELDCRLLPDQNPEDFVQQLALIINDDGISIEKIMGFTPAVSSAKTPLFRALSKVSGEVLGAQVIPTVAGGFTDSHFFRDMGITSYGYSPFVFTISEFSGVHGNDERVSVKNMVEGVKTLHKVLLEFATDR